MPATPCPGHCLPDLPHPYLPPPYVVRPHLLAFCAALFYPTCLCHLFPTHTFAHYIAIATFAPCTLNMILVLILTFYLYTHLLQDEPYRLPLPATHAPPVVSHSHLLSLSISSLFLLFSSDNSRNSEKTKDQKERRARQKQPVTLSNKKQ